MFKKITKKRNRYKYEESAIKPNADFGIDDISDYQHVIKKEQDLGHKGLKVAYIDKSAVRLVIQKNNGDNEEVIGTISHYDDNFSQLVVLTGNSLKRLTFNQIVDAQLVNGGTQDEKFSEFSS